MKEKKLQFLVTAGPTREYIDDVRFISNASSGRMGIAIAEAAKNRGYQVHLVVGPVEAQIPGEIKVTNVVSAMDMERAVRASARDADIVVMTAAVADFRPAFRHKGKIKKSMNLSRGGRMAIEFVENPDILAGLGKRRRKKGQMLVGFALETDRVVESAREKLETKKADIIVANHAASVGSENTKFWIIEKGGKVHDWPSMPKKEAADKLVDFLVAKKDTWRE